MLNKVILMGRLTRSPELRHTQNNVPVVSFSLAVDRGYSRNASEGQQTVDFVNIVAWRGTAEFVSKWFSKGQLVAVSGRIQVRSWMSDTGENRTTTEVVADEVYFAESKRDGQQTTSEEAYSPSLPSVPDYSDIGFEDITLQDDGDLPF